MPSSSKTLETMAIIIASKWCIDADPMVNMAVSSSCTSISPVLCIVYSPHIPCFRDTLISSSLCLLVVVVPIHAVWLTDIWYTCFSLIDLYKSLVMRVIHL